MAPYAEAAPLYGIVWPILISVAVMPGVVSLGVPAPPTRPRPTEMESAAAAILPSRGLLFDIIPSYAPCACAVARSRRARSLSEAGDRCAGRQSEVLAKDARQ